ncbi:MAG: PorT family protein [Gemmatimonadota bacterium]|nr:MAG: PorT family protein [Gemmatimonadota bacterium]
MLDCAPILGNRATELIAYCTPRTRGGRVRYLVMLAVLTLISVSSASPAYGQLRGGLIGGATYSKLSGEFITSSDYKWSWMAGGFVEVPYRENWSLALELLYVNKGGTGVTDQPQEFDVEIGYVEVPLLANFQVPLGDRLTAGLYGGFSVGVSVNCGARVGTGAEVSCADALSSAATEWAIPLGGRLGFGAPGGSTVYLDFRYAVPLSDALEVESFKILSWQLAARWSRGV